MGLFLDSARIEEVQKAVELGFLAGVTTNPTIIAKANGQPKDIIREICAISPGPVFYQITTKTPAEREREGREFYLVNPEKVVLKIPATTENMTLMARLSMEIPCAATAVYSGHQTIVACDAGARYVIPYVNRATRLLGDGCRLVAEMASVVKASGRVVEILAASIKSAEEATQAVLAGANHLTLPLDILLSLGNHPLSEAAIEEFGRSAKTGC
ncbi:transaldolase [candidate division WOR-3 bacterium]|uniref:Transaldolase n=1 Tax=candidate division WOR-3 bacterium TaxID=2052148 RepID=A0A937XGD8_UNCW3|nr:transaldolase [candidate division WOR-3 bacterium]